MRLAPIAVVAFLVACKADEPPPDTAPTEETPTETTDPERFAAIVEAVELDLQDNLATAAQVAVWIDGKVVHVGGFGTADPEGDREVGRDTMFMIGSDTKKLTALSLLRKVEAGALDLDDTVGALLPELDMARAPVFLDATVHDLISHQGGIVDASPFATSTTDEELAAFTYADFASTYHPLAPPGSFWNYANPNFSVAGLIDETIDGRAWADIVAEDLFAPLGMDRTVARKADVDDDLALGFGFDAMTDTAPGPVKRGGIWEHAWPRPAGLVWSTAEDQARLAAFLVDGDDAVLDPALLAEVHAPQVPLYPDLPGAYGYGLFVQDGFVVGEDYYDVPVWTHGGNTFTHTSTILILPEQRFAVVVLSNGYGDLFPRTLEAAVASLVTLPAPTDPPEAEPPDPTVWDGLVGTYSDPFNVGDLLITRDEDGLTMELPRLDQFGIPYEPELTPLSNRVWIGEIQGYPLDLSFIEGEDGTTWVRNRSFVASRAPIAAFAPRAAPDRAAVEAAVRRLAIDPVPPMMRPGR